MRAGGKSCDERRTEHECLDARDRFTCDGALEVGLVVEDCRKVTWKGAT